VQCILHPLLQCGTKLSRGPGGKVAASTVLWGRYLLIRLCAPGLATASARAGASKQTIKRVVIEGDPVVRRSAGARAAVKIRIAVSGRGVVLDASYTIRIRG